MDRAVIPLVVVVVCLFGVGCRSDSVKGTPRDIPLLTIENKSLEEQTVGVKDVGGNKDGGEALQGESEKNLGKKKDMPLDERESKPLNETMPKEEKPKDANTLKTMPKENGQGEECDASSSSSCMDDKSQLIACLRVPGNDSPTLSLMVQNRGASPVNITISAPNSVKLQKTALHLPSRKDEKVKISFEDGIGNNPISLIREEWHCNLSFWDMIPDSIKKNMPSPNPAYPSSTRTTSMVYALLGLILITGVAYLLLRFRQQHSHEEALGYQKLDVALPVSTGGLKEKDVGEGWDNSWGDNWDDEEAPVTPSTPSLNLSSKGLASRRVNKEGWKD